MLTSKDFFEKFANLYDEWYDLKSAWEDDFNVVIGGLADRCYKIYCTPYKMLQIIESDTKDEFISDAKLLISDDLEYQYWFEEGKLLETMVFVRFDLGVFSSIPFWKIIDEISSFNEKYCFL